MRPIVFAALGLVGLIGPSMWLASGCAAGNDTGAISQGVTGSGTGGRDTSTSTASNSGGAGGIGGASATTGGGGKGATAARRP